MHFPRTTRVKCRASVAGIAVARTSSHKQFALGLVLYRLPLAKQGEGGRPADVVRQGRPLANSIDACFGARVLHRGRHVAHTEHITRTALHPQVLLYSHKAPSICTCITHDDERSKAYSRHVARSPYSARIAPIQVSHPGSEEATKGEVSLLEPGRRCCLSAPEALIIGLRLLGIEEQLPVLHCNYLGAFMQLYALLLPNTGLLSRAIGSQVCILAHVKQRHEAGKAMQGYSCQKE